MSLLHRDELAALHPQTIAQILADHEGRVRPTIANEPPMALCYTTNGGAFLGVRFPRDAPYDRAIVIPDNWLPEEADLEAVRVDARSGDVVRNVVRPRPEPTSEPEPAVEPAPNHEDGRPLGETEARSILLEHSLHVPNWVRHRLGNLTPEVAQMPSVRHAYGVGGTYVGSPTRAGGVEQIERLVILSDEELPTPEQLVQWVRVHPDGRVTLVRS